LYLNLENEEMKIKARRKKQSHSKPKKVRKKTNTRK
jgi:hypothetical protein